MMPSSRHLGQRLWNDIGPIRLFVLFVFMTAAIVRLVYLDDSRMMAERQFRSALIARADFLSAVDDVPQWRRDIADISADRMGMLEPPIMENLTAVAWRMLGREALWVPKLLASAFWLIGGVCLFLLARELTGEEAALYGAVYFLFLPLGVAISVSFLPDSLMMMLLAAGLLSLFRYERAQSMPRFLLAACLCGACVLVKPLGLFTIATSFVALRWSRKGFPSLFEKSAVLFGTIVAAPAVIWYGYGIYVAGFLEGQAEASFLPALLLEPSFWRDTLVTALRAVGAIPLMLALLGFSLPASREFRWMIIGLVGGYALLCLTFTYHVRISGHYHLQLAIPVAIALGATVQAIVDRVRRGGAERPLRYVSIVSAAVLLATLGARQISDNLDSANPIVDPAVARAVGEAVGHSANVVYVSQFYGVPLEYFGELSGWYWPRAETSEDRALLGVSAPRRTIEERLRSLGTVLARASDDFEAEYFAITDFREFSNHDDLAQFLEARCRFLDGDTEYRVYGDCDLNDLQ